MIESADELRGASFSSSTLMQYPGIQRRKGMASKEQSLEKYLQNLVE
jgi:hypothetical protein